MTIEAVYQELFYAEKTGATSLPVDVATMRTVLKALEDIRALSGGGYEFSESTALRAWEIACETLGAQS